jgi:hypothetical protein
LFAVVATSEQTAFSKSGVVCASAAFAVGIALVGILWFWQGIELDGQADQLNTAFLHYMDGNPEAAKPALIAMTMRRSINRQRFVLAALSFACFLSGIVHGFDRLRSDWVALAA